MARRRWQLFFLRIINPPTWTLIVEWYAYLLLTDGDRLPVTTGNMMLGISATFALAVPLHHLVEDPGRRWLRGFGKTGKKIAATGKTSTT